MKEFDFEWLENIRHTRLRGQYAFVSISGIDNRIYISVRAMEKLLEHCPDVKGVEVGINQFDKQLALVPKETLGIKTLKLYDGGSDTQNSKLIYSSELMDKIIEMVYETSTRFPVEWDEEVKGLIVDLNNPIT